MSTKTINISLPDDLYKFLKENSSLSASKVMQGALINIQNSLKSNPQLMEANKTILDLEKHAQLYQKRYLKATDFLEKKGLWEEFDKDVLEQN